MHIFLDESGKPEVFSAKGVNLVANGAATKHLVIAAVKTTDHLSLQQGVTEFKNGLLKDPAICKELSADYALDSFHANHDKEIIRRAFYEYISGLKGIEVHVIVVEKTSCTETLQRNPLTMYGLMSGLLLQGMAHQDNQAEIIFSRQDKRKQFKEQLELEVERIREYYWAKHKRPPEGINLRYQHNPHYSHAGLQIADYVAFATFRHFETNDSKYLASIQGNVRHIYHFNNKEHFTLSRPLKLS